MEQQLKASQYHLTDVEILKMCSVSDKRDSLLIALMGFCGLRRNEARTLTIEDVQLEKMRLKIVGKGNKFRVVPFDDLVKNHFNNYWMFYYPRYYSHFPSLDQTSLLGHKYLFPSRYSATEPMNNNWVNELVKNAGRKAGVQHPNPLREHVNPHILRHSYAHRLKTKKIPLEVIRDLMGHSTILTTADQYGSLSLIEIEKLLKES